MANNKDMATFNGTLLANGYTKSSESQGTYTKGNVTIVAHPNSAVAMKLNGSTTNGIFPVSNDPTGQTFSSLL